MSRTARSIALLDGNGSIRAEVRTGTSSTPTGKSHSCDRPTSSARAPSAQTVSVADGRSEAMRTATRIPDPSRGIGCCARHWAPTTHRHYFGCQLEVGLELDSVNHSRAFCRSRKTFASAPTVEAKEANTWETL